MFKPIHVKRFNYFQNLGLFFIHFIDHSSSVRKSRLNYIWLYTLFINLCDEYTRRYNREHLTDTKLRKHLKKLPENLKGCHFTKFPQAMPDEYKDNCIVTAYNNFYKTKKLTLTYKKNK